MSNAISFKNPNAPLWPRLALGEEWDEVSRTCCKDFCLSTPLKTVYGIWGDLNYTDSVYLKETNGVKHLTEEVG